MLYITNVRYLMETHVTDWIQAIGVLLGIPATIWGIFSLFRKDKEKEMEIDALNNMAISQNEVVIKLTEQIEQLTLQSNEFQYHSNLMLERNKILEKQFELQNAIYLGEKATSEKQEALEKSKHLLAIKPFFINNMSQSSPISFSLRLENKGGDARNIRIVNNHTDFVWFRRLDNININQYDSFEIIGGANAEKTFYNGNNVTFEIQLEFDDIEGNTYSQTINRYNNGKYTISDPEPRQV